ncbi:glycine/sarcosine/betaine reductase selenoprotein B family protein [Ilumatobacter nonamiensis]|uniref:glycine/sarcosine/betaine reductase selenoprotein B family protein n=1 Tax=Ilumatobacter nonamiensis TaxID=467093 RepID=UPI0006849752|nr:glycine/sarcosine/betaine reductase selenoprotein B family protein [Ilumatobacter nonamiensis]
MATPSPRADRQLVHRSFVSYIDKSREYYRAQGFEQAYRWAAFDEVAFTASTKALAESNVAVVTTSFLHHHDSAFGAPATDKEVYHHPVDEVPERMFTDDLSWDKQETHTDDTESFLPVAALRDLAKDGVIASLNHRFFGVPTEYSQRKTGLDADQIATWCAEDGVDIALLVPL